MSTKNLICTAVVASISYGAAAASFDCTKASSSLEKTICSTPSLSALDDQLAQAYKDARSRSSNPDQLKATQVDWIKSVRLCQSEVACIEKAYKTRISELAPTTSSAPVRQPGSTDSSAIKTALNQVKVIFESMANADRKERIQQGIEGKSAFTEYTTNIVGRCAVQSGSKALVKLSSGNQTITAFQIFDFSQMTSAFVSPLSEYTFSNDKETNQILKDSMAASGDKFVVGTKGSDARIYNIAGRDANVTKMAVPLWGIATKTNQEALSLKKAFDDAIAACKS